MVWSVSLLWIENIRCKIIAPVFEEYSKKYPNATFVKVDVDEAPEIAQAVGVRAMPTFQIYVNGAKDKEIVGADKVKLEQAIQSVTA